MEIIKKHKYLPIRRQVKPGLLNRDFIERYIDSYGKPDCFCCKNELEMFVPALAVETLRIYCVNCALTIQCCGVCQHG